MKGRGVHAWENYARDDPWMTTGVIRALVHKVKDPTNLQKYIPAVERFLDWCEVHDISLGAYELKDAALARYINFLIYERQSGAHEAANLVAGFMHVYPEFTEHSFPLAHRAMETHRLLRPGGEGEPCPWEAVVVLAESFAREGYPGEALAILLQADCALREMDWEGALVEDLHDDGEQLCLELGVRERGESSKTGVKQGVIIGRWWIRLMVLVMMKSKNKSDRLFPFSQQHVRALWNWLKKKHRLNLGPLHWLRHTEPAASIAERRRTLEEVRRLGRWASLTSVERYSKTHLLVKQREQLPVAVRERGEYLLEHPGELVQIILEAEPRKKMGCCRRRRTA